MFKQKTVFITGANRGIGKAIADRFYLLGANLVLTVKNINKYEHEYSNDRVYFQELDLENEKNQYGSILKKCVEHFGKIDILVNNAGIDEPLPILDITKEHLMKIFNVNLFSVILLTQQICKHMIMNNYGKIVNVSSIAGKQGTKNHIAYSSSKHALIGFTQCLAKEMIGHNINVNAVCPGLINTDMSKNYFEIYSDQINSTVEQEIEKFISLIPKGSMGNPDDVAKLVTFLCSEDASYIVGQSINTDGGYLWN